MQRVFSNSLVILLAMVLVLSTRAMAGQAPQFSLTTADGKIISLADYKGKPLILHFWATWCPACKRLHPGLDALYQKYHPQGLELLAVSIWEDEGATPQAELDKRGNHFKTVIKGDEITSKYHVRGTPTTYFIGRDGQIELRTSTSDPNDPRLEEMVKVIMASKSSTLLVHHLNHKPHKLHPQT